MMGFKIDNFTDSFDMSKIIGFFVHNRTSANDMDVTNFAFSNFVVEDNAYSMKYGDVIGLDDNDELTRYFYDMFIKSGMSVELIKPNILYKMSDSVVIHYIILHDIDIHNINNMNEYLKDIIDNWENSKDIDVTTKRREKIVKMFRFLNS